MAEAAHAVGVTLARLSGRRPASTRGTPASSSSCSYSGSHASGSSNNPADLSALRSHRHRHVLRAKCDGRSRRLQRTRRRQSTRRRCGHTGTRSCRWHAGSKGAMAPRCYASGDDCRRVDLSPHQRHRSRRDGNGPATSRWHVLLVVRRPARRYIRCVGHAAKGDTLARGAAALDCRAMEALLLLGKGQPRLAPGVEVREAQMASTTRRDMRGAGSPRWQRTVAAAPTVLVAAHAKWMALALRIVEARCGRFDAPALRRIRGDGRHGSREAAIIVAHRVCACRRLIHILSRVHLAAFGRPKGDTAEH